MNKPLLIVSTAAAFLFASCSNENTTNPEPVGTATIKGAVIADLNEDDDADEPPLEKVPAGVTLFFYDDNTGALLATTLTTAEGYSVDLQVGAPRDIVIVVGDFETTVNFNVGGGDFENKKTLYNDREDFFVGGVSKGATYIQNLEINQPTELDF